MNGVASRSSRLSSYLTIRRTSLAPELLSGWARPFARRSRANGKTCAWVVASGGLSHSPADEALDASSFGRFAKKDAQARKPCRASSSIPELRDSATESAPLGARTSSISAGGLLPPAMHIGGNGSVLRHLADGEEVQDLMGRNDSSRDAGPGPCYADRRRIALPAVVC